MRTQATLLRSPASFSQAAHARSPRQGVNLAERRVMLSKQTQPRCRAGSHEGAFPQGRKPRRTPRRGSPGGSGNHAGDHTADLAAGVNNSGWRARQRPVERNTRRAPPAPGQRWVEGAPAPEGRNKSHRSRPPGRRPRHRIGRRLRTVRATQPAAKVTDEARPGGHSAETMTGFRTGVMKGARARSARALLTPWSASHLTAGNSQAASGSGLALVPASPQTAPAPIGGSACSLGVTRVGSVTLVEARPTQP